MPKRKTLLTMMAGLPGTLQGRESFEPEPEAGYWSKEKFEERFVKNTLAKLYLLDEAEKRIGREPKKLGDLWEVIKKDNARPLSEQWGDVSDILTEKANALSRALGLKTKR